ncbi:acid protease [Polyplosphaeria fusca]|uniref:Acid protease n=1 Tax=Polyplosphaeria fusca TaxID=682080 RepID=A0A9P4V1F3_9PLEO|nr:acid protease [Polyplosphaeria fusca]
MFFKKRADSANATVIPAPVSVPATNLFDGNDGRWSTFQINVGDDDTGAGQNFRVLISTSSPLILLPVEVSWCDQDCAADRGVDKFKSQQPMGFETQSSKGWNQKGLFEIPLADGLTLWPDQKPNGTYGLDNVGIGASVVNSTLLGDQFVATSPSKDFFMGTLGLAYQPVNPGTGSISPFLTNFAETNNSPSISYGYAAGASYRNDNNGVVGSLVFGGYDQARFTSPQISVGFPAVGNNSLVVGVQSITYKEQRDSNEQALIPDAQTFSAAIDSSLPYLWLPDGVCDEFATRFQLDYDETRNMYTLSDSAHTQNVGNNATIVVGLGAKTNSKDTVSIALPYAAFDLQASEPIFNNATRYFPLKKSTTGDFILGRAFLQEAYIYVDYERENFTIARAAYSDPMPDPHLVTIYSTSYVPPPATTSNAPPERAGGLSGGAIAGIVVGILVLFLLISLGVFLWWRRRRNQRRMSQKTLTGPFDTTEAGNEVKPRRISELDSTHSPGSPKPSVGGYYGPNDKEPFPPISEIESPPAELWSPPPESSPGSGITDGNDYFTTAAGKVRRRGATRESSGNNTPGTPGMPYELPADEGQSQVGGSAVPVRPRHNRLPSESSLQTNTINEVVMGSREQSLAPAPDRAGTHSREPSQPGVGTAADLRRAASEARSDVSPPRFSHEHSPARTSDVSPQDSRDASAAPHSRKDRPEISPIRGSEERRPSLHQRGPSDAPTESTAVSQPTPEERERWEQVEETEEERRRPLSQ